MYECPIVAERSRIMVQRRPAVDISRHCASPTAWRIRRYTFRHP
jgi:hypothetical protein